ncbi:hypothetical protein P3X46_011180 [Hevea brasiliensis]|uniref:RING-type domain-containing protein n=1 Tax=Hevea brasiliensis TaxID=3981 RepID=A0ABQ9MHI5_HEVBR|nr:RING-H2 finger protein ATL63-like [Hevea brasiliensis]KAJ9179388.1 hypothetical protein P3X46_011180 [Hevea brasiliensis]
MHFLWYGLVMFGTIAIAFALYTLVMIGWRKSHNRFSHPELTSPAEQNSNVSMNLSPYSASTFRYQKGIRNTEAPETECIVCLSEFQDEEYVRQLSHCRHSFHAPCIDMWLYSHSDCPLCRTPIHRLDSEDGVLTTENSIEGMLDVRISS